MSEPTLRMVRTPGCVSGSWRLDGTRMPAHVLHGFAAAGYDTDGILAQYPHLTAEQIIFAVDWYSLAFYGGREPRRTAGPSRPRPVAVVSS